MTVTERPPATSAVPPATAGPDAGDRRLALHAFGVLLLRDVRVVGKNLPQFALRVVMQPLLFTFVFAYVLPKTGSGPGGRSASGPGGLAFATILVPGLVATAVFFQGIQSVALPLTQEFSTTREIEDRVLAPLPVWAVGLGKILAGSVQSLLAAAVVFPIVLVVHAKGQGPKVHVGDPLLLVVVVVLSCLLAGTFGLAVGTTVSPRQIPLVFALIVLPSTLLGCIYYPWATLHSIRFLQVLVLVNPLVYMSEAMRTALTPSVHHMPLVASLGAMLLATGALGALALRKFRGRVLS